MSEKIIEVKEVNKVFHIGRETVPILNNVSFSVNKGDFVSIMGPSGCGKSTLLYLMGGLDNPTSGQVYINNEDIHKLRDKQKSILRRRTIGFIFQFYNLVANLNVEENIMLPLVMDGKKAKDYQEELEKLLDIVNLKDRRKFTPRELSGGQQQRVAIARALINAPDILMADEPIGNLDSKSGTEIMELFQRINEERKVTIVQVTHSEESAQYGKSIIHLRDGVIERRESLPKVIIPMPEAVLLG
jgi:putative ABC transport system ATP-binding protein